MKVLSLIRRIFRVPSSSLNPTSSTTKQMIPPVPNGDLGIYERVVKAFGNDALHPDPPPAILALCKDCAGWHNYFECPKVSV